MGDKPQTPNLPSKPNGNGVPDPDQALRGDSRLDGRITAQRVTPQSPNEALQPDTAPPPPPKPPPAAA